jgi:hypothetical protein
MYSVPGKYSGGEGDRFTWTQTLHEVEVRAPLPVELPPGAVSCTFRARGIDVSWDGANSIKGQLTDTVVVDDCLWLVERDDGAVLVATMRKAVPVVWTKLFSTDQEPAEPPTLLDGLAGRSAPDGSKTKSKAEMLRDAKKHAAAELSGPSQAKLHIVEHRKNETVTLAANEMPQLAVSDAPSVPACGCLCPKHTCDTHVALRTLVAATLLSPHQVVVIRQCEGCEFTLAADTSVIKLQLESCKGCTLKLRGRRALQRSLHTLPPTCPPPTLRI